MDQNTAWLRWKMNLFCCWETSSSRGRTCFTTEGKLAKVVGANLQRDKTSINPSRSCLDRTVYGGFALVQVRPLSITAYWCWKLKCAGTACCLLIQPLKILFGDCFQLLGTPDRLVLSGDPSKETEYKEEVKNSKFNAIVFKRIFSV